MVTEQKTRFRRSQYWQRKHRPFLDWEWYIMIIASPVWFSLVLNRFRCPQRSYYVVFHPTSLPWRNGGGRPCGKSSFSIRCISVLTGHCSSANTWRRTVTIRAQWGWSRPIQILQVQLTRRNQMLTRKLRQCNGISKWATNRWEFHDGIALFSH